MSRRAWLVMVLTLAAWPAAIASSPTPSLVDPLPFDHEVHARALDRAGLGCLGCHPVGLRASTSDATTVPSLPPPPLSSCHGCHQGEVKGAGRGAPSWCTTCHADHLELRPLDHGPDWIALHGVAARAAGNGCQDCHAASTCLDCHERRGAGSPNPHGVGFQRYHGVEARLDPRSCSSCHTEASCVACHTTGASPW